MYVHISCSDHDRKYKYVSVQNFIDAFASTDTAKRTQAKLAAPVVINEKAEDPLVRTSITAASTVFVIRLPLALVVFRLLAAKQGSAGCAQLVRPGFCTNQHVLIWLQTKKTWANTQSKLLKATLRREFTLIQRTFFIYIFRSTQVPIRCRTSCLFGTLQDFCGPCVRQQSVMCFVTTDRKL